MILEYTKKALNFVENLKINKKKGNEMRDDEVKENLWLEHFF